MRERREKKGIQNHTMLLCCRLHSQDQLLDRKKRRQALLCCFCLDPRLEGCRPLHHPPPPEVRFFRCKSLNGHHSGSYLIEVWKTTTGAPAHRFRRKRNVGVMLKRRRCSRDNVLPVYFLKEQVCLEILHSFSSKSLVWIAHLLKAKTLFRREKHKKVH